MGVGVVWQEMALDEFQGTRSGKRTIERLPRSSIDETVLKVLRQGMIHLSYL